MRYEGKSEPILAIPIGVDWIVVLCPVANISFILEEMDMTGADESTLLGSLLKSVMEPAEV